MSKFDKLTNMLMLTLPEIKPLLLNPDLNEGKLITALQKIQNSFTRDLDKREIYIAEKDLVSAYAAFYLPTNFIKLRWGFSNLDQSFLDELKSTTLVDFGCGPGTYSLAWLDYFKDTNVVCVDQSDLMLKQAKKFIDHHFPKTEVKYLNILPKNLQNETTLLFGNSLNEISYDKGLSLIETLKPKNIIFIEPGTKLVFKQLIEIRNVLIRKNYHIQYPCLNNKFCPMTEDDWCHQVIRTTHDESIERISQKAKIDRRTMPLTFHVYSKKENQSEVEARIIQFLRESKFSFDYRVCVGDKIHEIQIMKKSLSKKEQKNIKKINVGESLNYIIQKKVNDHLYKVVLSK